MRAKGTNAVGRFALDFEVANQGDIIKARDGLLDQSKVRRLTISGIVDSGATRLVLPGKVVKQLGLPYKGKVKVRYANSQSATRDAVKEVYVQLLANRAVNAKTER
jgi:hypothetical protein